MLTRLFLLATLVACIPATGDAQSRIRLSPNCGIGPNGQYIIDDNHQLYFKIKSPTGVEHSIMVRIPASSGDEDMALIVSNAIDQATGTQTDTDDPTGTPEKPDPSQEDVVLEPGWCFVTGCTYKYKQTPTGSKTWKSKQTGHLDVDYKNDGDDDYTDEPQNRDPRGGKKFGDDPPGGDDKWPNPNW